MNAPVDAASVPVHMSTLRTLGAPYTDAEIAAAVEDVTGKTEMEALVAYLQVLGTTSK